MSAAGFVSPLWSCGADDGARTSQDALANHAEIAPGLRKSADQFIVSLKTALLDDSGQSFLQLVDFPRMLEAVAGCWMPRG